jgi:hypothetical protein
LTKGKYGERVEIDTPVILAPVLEYVTVDILESAHRNRSAQHDSVSSCL